MAQAEFTITLKRDKVFDEMIECGHDLAEILEMIPEYRQREANPIAQRIINRLKSWVSIESK